MPLWSMNAPSRDVGVRDLAAFETVPRGVVRALDPPDTVLTAGSVRGGFVETDPEPHLPYVAWVVTHEGVIVGRFAEPVTQTEMGWRPAGSVSWTSTRAVEAILAERTEFRAVGPVEESRLRVPHDPPWPPGHGSTTPPRPFREEPEIETGAHAASILPGILARMQIDAVPDGPGVQWFGQVGASGVSAAAAVQVRTLRLGPDRFSAMECLLPPAQRRDRYREGWTWRVKVWAGRLTQSAST